MKRLSSALPATPLTALALVSLTLAAVTPRAEAQGGQIARSYRIGPRDQIQIHVVETADLNQQIDVAEDGTISLPLVGTLEAQGLTEAELATRLREMLEARGLRKATVTISVTNFRSRPVSILGAVARPGNHLVAGRATLVEVLMDAGGVTAARGGEIVLRRRAGNGLSDELRISIVDLIEAGSPKLNIPIFAGDLINVPVARDVTVYLMGEVSSPGTLTFKPDQQVTLLTAIARAGGLSENASKKVRILRNSPSGAREEIVVDFRSILNNREPDVVLVDGDLVVVKESFF
jgi:polysaccharide export outer membrane protein